MRDFKFTEQEHPTMANFNARFDAIAALANGLGNEYVWLRNDGTYVNSPDTNAYPPAEPDGYTYNYLGQIGEKTRIATGSYIGTGTYGESNPNTLTFDFEPQVLFIVGKPASWNAFMPSIGQIINNKTSTKCVVGFSYGSGSNASIGGTGTAKILYGMFDNKKITWFANSENIQLNISNVTYEYIAIG